MSGSEGSGEAATLRDVANDLTGRWAYNCSTGVGPLSFGPGRRFTAPGGSGRYELDVRAWRITFIFEDGATENWSLSQQPGSLHLERSNGSLSRVYCSEEP